VGWILYEELDEAVGGENFGWPFREGPVLRAPPDCSEPGGTGSQSYAAPIAAYDRSSLGSASIIAGPRYRPSPGGAYNFPGVYHGAVFYAEYFGGFIRVIQENGGTWSPLGPVSGQPNATDWATGIVTVGDFNLGPDGAIYYLRQFPGSLRRIIYTGTVTGVPEDGAPPRLLFTARPNPFRVGGGPLTIEVGEEIEGRGSIRVLDVSGREIRTLFEGPLTAAGAATWDGRDARGYPVPSGIYFLQLVAPGGRAATRIVLYP
jgi:hypothetical protein